MKEWLKSLIYTILGIAALIAFLSGLELLSRFRYGWVVLLALVLFCITTVVHGSRTAGRR